MRLPEILALYDYSYWANRQVLAAAADIPNERFTAPSEGFTWRGLRGTLVHLLDVERGWRRRIEGQPRETWAESLPEENFPTVASLAEACERDEEEMRAWLGGLDDEQLASTVDLGESNRFPLWYFLLHIVTHSIEQRRDAALLLTRAGRSPGDLEFLFYVDSLRDRPENPSGEGRLT